MLNETVNAIGLFGMLMSVAGISWFTQVTQRQHNHIDPKLIWKGIAFAILGAVGQGLGLVCAKKGLIATTHNGLPINAIHATWIRMSVGAISAYTLSIFRTGIYQEFKTLITNSYQVKPLLIGTLFGPVMGVSLSLLAATHLQVGIAQTIFSLLPVTVLFAATILHGEKLNLIAVAATLISITGVLVLVWRDRLSELSMFW